MNEKFSSVGVRTIVAACAVACLSVCGAGVTNVWKAGSADWSLPESYEKDGVPGAGDVVKIPDDVTAYVTNASSYAVVKDLSWLWLNNPESKVVFDVPEGETWVVKCTIRVRSVTEAGAYYGGLIKKGKGDLEFAIGEHTEDIEYFVYTPITVEEGAVVLPQNYYDGVLNAEKIHCRCGPVTVKEGAYLVTSRPDDAKAQISYAVTYTPELWGHGTVSNRCKSVHRLVITGKNTTSEFHGVIGSNVRYHQTGNVNLLGDATESESHTTVTDGGSIGVKKFGYDSEDSGSSIPLGSLELLSACTVRYLGTGETTAKPVITKNLYDKGPAVFDGGTNGALVLAGTFGPDGTHASAGYMHLLELTGDHPHACEISGSLSSWEYGESPGPATYTVKKTGDGIWKFSNDSNPWSGALFIEDGTIRTTSIGNIGDASAIGSAANRTPFEKVSVADAPSRQLAYAICLGGASTSGTLEYVGESRVDVTNRPIALSGKGGAVINSSESAVAYRGVSALAGATDVSFTVGGGSQAENIIAEVTDGNGKVSLVKDGSGCWTLGGVNSFSGTLTVRSGTLYVNDPTKYSWFRWVLKSRYDDTVSDANVKVVELGIYDEENKRINTGLTASQTYSYLRPGSLEAGMCAIDRSGTHHHTIGTTTYPLSSMFNDKDYTDCSHHANIAVKDENGETVHVDSDDPSTWIPVVMRLENGSPRAASFDVVQADFNSSVPGRYFDEFGFEGSIDGIHWDVLTNVTLTTIKGGWVASGKGYKWDGAVHEGGFRINGGPAGAKGAFDGVESVSVSAGARLVSWGDIEIGSLTVDADGAGTIENFRFAEKGTLRVDNYDGVTAGLPGVFVNCTGVANIGNWTLEFGGTREYQRRIRVTPAGEIRILPCTMVISVR